jgi:hypothetical protein
MRFNFQKTALMTFVRRAAHPDLNWYPRFDGEMRFPLRVRYIIPLDP